MVNPVISLDDGWRVALTTLAFERRFGGVVRPRYTGAPGRVLDEARREADVIFKTYDWYPQRAGRVDLVVSRARGLPRDPSSDSGTPFRDVLRR